METYLVLLEETFEKIADVLQLVTPTTFLIVDSTPLVDLYDMEQAGVTLQWKIPRL